MTEKILFKSSTGEPVSNRSLVEKLKEMGAADCDVLYVHTALTFGVPQLKKTELLDALLEVFRALRVRTLIFPTFTFSFPNGEAFDVQNSKTPMGILNEYFRKQPGVIRSVDPLMSVALEGEHTEFATSIGKNSCGEDSTFDMLHKTELSVKFLFFGTRVGDCFTFMHYLEDLFKAPYRYPKPFTGTIINNGCEYTDTFNLCVRYSNAFPGPGSYIYENILLERGIARQTKVGESQMTLVPESAASVIYQDLLVAYPSFFLSAPFEDAKKSTEFKLNGPMIAL